MSEFANKRGARAGVKVHKAYSDLGLSATCVAKSRVTRAPVVSDPEPAEDHPAAVLAEKGDVEAAEAAPHNTRPTEGLKGDLYYSTPLTPLHYKLAIANL